MSLLTLENIVKEYNDKPVLNGACLRVQRKERVSLTGANGSGKTTLLRIAMGFETAEQGTVVKAKQLRIGYLSQNLKELEGKGIFTKTAAHYEKISMLEQKMREIEAEMSSGINHSESDKMRMLMRKYSQLNDEFASMDGYTAEARLKSTLVGLGLREESLTIPVSSLSGGEKMRVALARILLDEPDLLILDEPTNHLDLQGVEWLEKFLTRFDGGVLIVSHDRYFLDQVATRVAELENGTITEKTANYSAYIEQKKIRQDFVFAERKRLKRAIKQNDLLVQKLAGMKRVTAAKSRIKMGERLRTELNSTLGQAIQDEHLGRITGPKLTFKQAKHTSAEIAKADGLIKRFGNVTLFSGADFLIRGGEKIGIIGPNGCGKTTLLNILRGLDTDFEGFARLGSWVKYGYLGQDIIFEDEYRTIMEELQAKKKMTDDDARNHLSRFQFYGDDIHKWINVLSGGEKVRLLLACIMLDEPDCLIMDEPTNHLDIPARDALESSLLQYKGTVVAISHDRFFLNRCVNRILEISAGKIISYSGNYEAYRQAKAAEQASCGMAHTGQLPTGTKPAAGNFRETEKYGKGKSKNCLNNNDSKDAEKLTAIETEIQKLEGGIKELESTFREDTPYQTYQEYQKLQEELSKLYEAWESLVEN